MTHSNVIALVMLMSLIELIFMKVPLFLTDVSPEILQILIK